MRKLPNTLTVAVTLFFLVSLVWIADSTGAGKELPEDIQSILKEIREQEAPGKSRGDINPSGEKRESQGKVENKGFVKPSVKPVLDSSDEKKTEIQSPSVDLLERAAIRYRNMIENASKEEAVAKVLDSQVEDISEEPKIIEEEQASLAGLNAKSTLEYGTSGKTRESTSSPENSEKSLSQLSTSTEGACRGLQDILEVIYARLNKIHKEISSNSRP